MQITLPHRGPVSVRVYDTLGQPIRTLMDGGHEAGIYQLAWDGRNETGGAVASGSYLYRLDAPRLSETRSMTLLR